MTASGDVVSAARKLADEKLFPDAMRVDGLDAVPAAHLDALAAEGLYGTPVPAESGGLGLDLRTTCAVVEELAGGCLATTFVWMQHRGVVRTLAAEGTPAGLRGRWLGPACQGKVRGGIALGGLLPGPPRLRARPADGEWRLDGEAPWVTGWGLIDLLLVAARGPDDSIVNLILDAAEQPGLTVSRQRLAAVNASVTVRLGFDHVMVPAERYVGQEPFDPAESLRPDRMRINGSLALGVAGRCGRLIGPGPLDDELAACRKRLDDALNADVTAMAQARAAASELAVRATAALAVWDGSRSIMTDQHPQRLAREALFLLVFGSRPAIKNALLRQLGTLPSPVPTATRATSWRAARRLPPAGHPAGTPFHASVGQKSRHGAGDLGPRRGVVSGGCPCREPEAHQPLAVACREQPHELAAVGIVLRSWIVRQANLPRSGRARRYRRIRPGA